MMRRILTAFILVGSLGCNPLTGPRGEPGSYDAFAWLADPYVAARRLPGDQRLASSRAPEPPSGSDNRDFSNFVRIDGQEAVLIDERGPGIVTRLWFTVRLDSMATAPGDEARLHVYVDGEEVRFGDDPAPGVGLGELTSGTLAAFPRPWVAGRDLSSGALQIFIPIQFQESIRITLDHVPDRTTYYHVDWRALPTGSQVRSFDGSLTSEQQAWLAAATELWVDRSERGAERLDASWSLAPGATETLSLDGPAVLREVALQLESGDPDVLEAGLVVDGAVVVDPRTASSWLFSTSPAGVYGSALSAATIDGGGSMQYPTPVHERAVLTVRNRGDTPIELGARLGFDPGPVPPGLGSLVIRCGAPLGETVDQNVVLAGASSERGHYAGQFLVVRGQEWGWNLMEGDHEVQVDGEYALLGTGIEDYFGGAFYYLDGPFALPFVGAPGFDLMGRPHLVSGRIDVAQYRHHLIDTVSYDESFSFEYEITAPRTRFEHCLMFYRD